MKFLKGGGMPKRIPPDLEIAQSAKMRPILDVADGIGIKRKEIELYGDYKAKVSPDVLSRNKSRPSGKYIDVTAMTPTPMGEGKTVTEWRSE